VYEKSRIGIDTVIAISTVFQDGKTTIPKEVRGMLALKDGDKILWHINEDDHVLISKRHVR